MMLRWDEPHADGNHGVASASVLFLEKPTTLGPGYWIFRPVNDLLLLILVLLLLFILLQTTRSWSVSSCANRYINRMNVNDVYHRTCIIHHIISIIIFFLFLIIIFIQLLLFLLFFLIIMTIFVFLKFYYYFCSFILSLLLFFNNFLKLLWLFLCF